jgi:hypothetical protein
LWSRLKTESKHYLVLYFLLQTFSTSDVLNLTDISTSAVPFYNDSRVVDHLEGHRESPKPIHPIQSNNSDITEILLSDQHPSVLQNPFSFSANNSSDHSCRSVQLSHDTNPSYKKSDEAALFGSIFEHDMTPQLAITFQGFPPFLGSDRVSNTSVFSLDNSRGGGDAAFSSDGQDVMPQDSGSNKTSYLIFPGIIGGGSSACFDRQGDKADTFMGYSGIPKCLLGSYAENGSTYSGGSSTDDQSYLNNQPQVNPAEQQQHANHPSPDFDILSSEFINPHEVKY